MMTGCQIWGGTFCGPVDTTLEAEKPISDIDAVTPPTPTATTRSLMNEKGPTAPPTANLMILIDPVMFRISSRPQAPASRSWPSTQFRKGRGPAENPFNPMEFSKSRARFRAWALGGDGSAGAWGRDEIRNVTGSFSAVLCGETTVSGALNQTFDGGYTTSSGSGGTKFRTLVLDISRSVSTGPQNVPQHIWQPIILYLGRPR